MEGGKLRLRLGMTRRREREPMLLGRAPPPRIDAGVGPGVVGAAGAAAGAAAKKHLTATGVPLPKANSCGVTERLGHDVSAHASQCWFDQ